MLMMRPESNPGTFRTTFSACAESCLERNLPAAFWGGYYSRLAGIGSYNVPLANPIHQSVKSGKKEVQSG